MGRKRWGETSMCEIKHQSVASCTPPSQGPGLQPRHVPWLGIEPGTFWFMEWCSTHWAAPVGAFRRFIAMSIKTVRQTLRSVKHCQISHIAPSLPAYLRTSLAERLLLASCWSRLSLYWCLDSRDHCTQNVWTSLVYTSIVKQFDILLRDEVSVFGWWLIIIKSRNSSIS